SIMETTHLQQHLQNQQQPNEDNSGGAKGSFLCRQSSTRWTPTADQIRILKDLYYNNGVRSPSAEQIQRISARLRQYGKIEGKNVFYWFQNHKARERQKKRFNNDVSMQQRALPNPSANWKPEDYTFPNKYSNINPGFASASSSSAGMVTVGQMGTCGLGSVTMEKSFKNCSISATANSSVGHKNGSWVGIDPYGYTLCDRRKTKGGEEDEETEEEDATPGIETLPLFPMHRENINGYCNFRHNSSFYYRNYRYGDDGTASSRSAASLELSLNSYTGQAPDSI
ncbi:hypothetical protein Tsubulata_032326, partial [Turnera subulata]